MPNNIRIELIELRQDFNQSLILNPTENIPWKCNEDISFTEGLYIPEDARDRDSKVCFAGRNNAQNIMTNLYGNWERALGAKASSFKLYSGLHAHILLFMILGHIGDKVLIIPENAGGHYATAKILRRLGLQVKECITDKTHFCIDITKTKNLIELWQPNFIFIDRSDGLNYEDFSWMNSYKEIYKIFDASQYLSHILANDYKNPFDMGMNLIITTLHKNYPGPQKAALFTKECDNEWEKIEIGLTDFISNSHPMEIFKAVLAFPHIEIIQDYSQKVLQNASALEEGLSKRGVPVVKRDSTQPSTQQIWIPVPSDEFGYRLFKRLEKMKFLTNYRMLPYNLGRGLRLGTAAATRQGLTRDNAILIGELIAEAYNQDALSGNLIYRAEKIIQKIKLSNSYFTEAQ